MSHDGAELPSVCEVMLSDADSHHLKTQSHIYLNNAKFSFPDFASSSLPLPLVFAIFFPE